jgi:hypothetical protein
MAAFGCHRGHIAGTLAVYCVRVFSGKLLPLPLFCLNAMKTPIKFVCACILLAGPALVWAEGKKLVKDENDSERSSLLVEAQDDAHAILDLVPSEAVMERLEMLDGSGRQLAWLGLTEGEVGGLVFVDKKLLGTLTRREAQAFYRCRGHVTAAGAHWAQDAASWGASLVAASKPATSVTLRFSGKSTPHSIKEVANIHALSQIGSIVDIGTNPLGILRRLNSANDNARERDRYDRHLRDLRALTPGSSEQKLVTALPPELVRYGNAGQILAYPRFAFEFYLVNGQVRLAQQPSFFQLAQLYSPLFYQAGGQWEQCSPKNWQRAWPEEK